MKGHNAQPFQRSQRPGTILEAESKALSRRPTCTPLSGIPELSDSLPQRSFARMVGNKPGPEGRESPPQPSPAGTRQRMTLISLLQMGKLRHIRKRPQPSTDRGEDSKSGMPGSELLQRGVREADRQESHMGFWLGSRQFLGLLFLLLAWNSDCKPGDSMILISGEASLLGGLVSLRS